MTINIQVNCMCKATNNKWSHSALTQKKYLVLLHSKYNQQHVALFQRMESLPFNPAHSICHCLESRLSDAVAQDEDYAQSVIKQVRVCVCMCACECV